MLTEFIHKLYVEKFYINIVILFLQSGNIKKKTQENYFLPFSIFFYTFCLIPFFLPFVSINFAVVVLRYFGLKIAILSA